MQPKDFFQPRVFLCKAGRFLSKLHDNVINAEGDYVDDPNRIGPFERDSNDFGTNEFEESCDPKDLIQKDDEQYDYEDDDIEATTPNIIYADEEPLPDDQEVIEVKNAPILVIEGLPDPEEGQDEEVLVETILKQSIGLPSNAVKKALRMPMKSPTEKSLVIVEMDTPESEARVLNSTSEVVENLNERLGLNAKFDSVGFHRAKYDELWRYMEELNVVRRVLPLNSVIIVEQDQTQTVDIDIETDTTENTDNTEEENEVSIIATKEGESKKKPPKR